MIPPPPLLPFPEVNRTTLPATTELHRIHSAEFSSNAFNPCMGRPSRFAPLIHPDGTCIPTAYAASTFECAVHETVFHEIQHDAPRKSIGFHVIENLDYAILRPHRDLVFASLFEPDLNKWGITRRNLIDTFPTDYADTARWAMAIHEAFTDLDGLVWTSRRSDPERAYLLFGDRVRPDELAIAHRQRIAETGSLLGQIREFAKRANIFIAF
jgi:hypothetical protein